MSDRKTIGIALLALGIMLLVVAVAADFVGIGSSAAFGYKQIAAAVAGVIVAIVGYFLYARN